MKKSMFAILSLLLMIVIAHLPVCGQASAHPAQLEAKSKQLKKLRGKAAGIWDDCKRNKEIAQKSIDEMLAAYSEVEQKAPADIPSAALLIADAYAAMGNRDNQMKYLNIIDANYDKAPKQVKVLSRIDMGWNNYRGYGTPKNEDKALEYFTQCYDIDPTQGAFPMAMAALFGIGNQPVDFNKSAQLLLKSKHGLRWPLIYAINYYLDNVENTPSVQEAWENYLTGLELYAIFAEPDKAAPYINKARDDNFLPAYQLLSDLYLEKGDRESALALIQPAVDAGYAPALHQKGWYIYSGTFGRLGQWKPIAEAFDLFENAADAGYPISQLTVAELYLYGNVGVVKVNYSMAYEYAVAAEKAGEPMAADLAKKAEDALHTETLNNYVKMSKAIIVNDYVESIRLQFVQQRLNQQIQMASKKRQSL